VEYELKLYSKVDDVNILLAALKVQAVGYIAFYDISAGNTMSRRLSGKCKKCGKSRKVGETVVDVHPI
jgi:hypothetical protein